jgi:hypothetical protein
MDSNTGPSKRYCTWCSHTGPQFFWGPLIFDLALELSQSVMSISARPRSPAAEQITLPYIASRVGQAGSSPAIDGRLEAF